MPNRVQTLRSSVAGNRPATGSQQPGTLYVNFADLQLGMINAAQAPQDLIGVRYFNATSNYNVGDGCIYGGNMYIARVAITAGAFTPSQWVQVVTAGSLAGDNRIINGDMRIDQRNSGASTTPATATYVIDRWAYVGTQTSKFTAQRITGAAAILGNGFGYYLGLVSQSAYTALATDIFYVQQIIEADAVVDLMWGTASAQPVTLSFWALSSLAGTFSGALGNAPVTRAYPFTFSLIANIWTKIAITIPGDTAGTWVMQGNLGGVVIRFDLGSGANARGPANAWASANYSGATGSVSVVGTNAASFSITGVKLEIGTVATPFNHPTMAKAMADCQRYYQTGQIVMAGQAGTASQSINASTMLPVLYRASSPTITAVGNSNANLSAVTYASGNGMVVAQTNAVAAGSFTLNVWFSVSSEL
jgi:hypothetical protein